jgi:hypothetical protein
MSYRPPIENLDPQQDPSPEELEPGRPAFRLLPDPSAESTPFWTGGANRHLLIHRCNACTRFFHPPAPACFRCRSMDIAPAPVSGRATVATYTINRHRWYEGFPAPYVIAIVELDEQPDVRLTTNIVECPIDDVRIGMRVEVRFERWVDLWIPVFSPVPA